MACGPKAFFFGLVGEGEGGCINLTLVPNEVLASNFSLQYPHWITHLGHKNKGNDHQLNKLLIVEQILLVSALGNV